MCSTLRYVQQQPVRPAYIQASTHTNSRPSAVPVCTVAHSLFDAGVKSNFKTV